MKNFDLLEPRTLPEAVSLLDPEDPGVRAIAGGTALMLMMKSRLYQPARLISLRRLNGDLRGVRRMNDGSLRIGAMTTLAEVEYSHEVARAFPVIHAAMPALSNIRIRNVATIGGHLAHGDPHMDLPPILLTLGARVRAVSVRGERWIPLAELFTGYYETALSHDELIADVELPKQPLGVHGWYAKFTSLSADDWPAVGVAVWFRRDSGVIAEARVAVSSATDRPIRMAGAEAELNNAIAGEATFARAATAAAEEVQPIADLRGTVAYKREMVRVQVRRALEQALKSNPSEAS